MAYSQLKTSTEPLSNLFIFYRNNDYRCPFLGESRTTTAVRSTSNIGACPDVPPTRAATNKVKRLLTLSRVCSLKSSTFVQQGISRPRTVPGPLHRWNTPDLLFRYDTLCGNRW